ncbi:NAD(P)/FAD-dependent oxidoreductase [Rhodococcus sp. T2V]|uniref:FAD-dependent oxidoreductase n=1 Tax=Rhodococcus sp. T2V TaxID=3034164 RepID=UPI0023E231B5|nr:NAD(P)/FAD-dependent oxidoreductase [Rhodococcus sp. T2V]MDF3313174.1 NAD(P)/FAD-dependent oxidoreductase [Rhodococcus sp. T2V]
MRVAVIGAGPVGLSAASALTEAGASVSVYEANADISRQWRASTFHPPTLEHLERYVSVPEMLKQGIRADRYQIRDRKAGVVADFDYEVLKADTPYPFRLQLEQYKFSEMVLERLRTRTDVDLNFGHRLVALDQTDEGAVELTMEGPDGHVPVRADYVIGADGASSTVRQLLGLDYEGWTYQERFLLISSHLPFGDYLPDLCDVNYLADPNEFVMILRTPDVWRILVPVPAGISDEAASDPARLHSTIEGIIGKSLTSEEAHIVHQQIYKVHQRVASSFWSGRAMLVGDAAHVNSPIGGFGLNSGLHDIFDLAVRFDRILREGADATAEFEAFAVGRRTVAREYVQRMSHQNTSTLMLPDDADRAAELARLRNLAAEPETARDYLLDRSMIRHVRDHGIGRRPGQLAEEHAGTVN